MSCWNFSELDEGRKCSGFQGMQRQAYLAIALACQPHYLLLDETFDGLDPGKRNLVRRILMEYIAEKGGVCAAAFLTICRRSRIYATTSLSSTTKGWLLNAIWTIMRQGIYASIAWFFRRPVERRLSASWIIAALPGRAAW